MRWKAFKKNFKKPNQTKIQGKDKHERKRENKEFENENFYGNHVEGKDRDNLNDILNIK